MVHGISIIIDDIVTFNEVSAVEFVINSCGSNHSRGGNGDGTRRHGEGIVAAITHVVFGLNRFAFVIQNSQRFQNVTFLNIGADHDVSSFKHLNSARKTICNKRIVHIIGIEYVNGIDMFCQCVDGQVVLFKNELGTTERYEIVALGKFNNLVATINHHITVNGNNIAHLDIVNRCESSILQTFTFINFKLIGGFAVNRNVIRKSTVA